MMIDLAMFFDLIQLIKFRILEFDRKKYLTLKLNKALFLSSIFSFIPSSFWFAILFGNLKFI